MGMFLEKLMGAPESNRSQRCHFSVDGTLFRPGPYAP